MYLPREQNGIRKIPAFDINHVYKRSEYLDIIKCLYYKYLFISSTELDVFNLTNQILSQMSKKSSVCGIFCDLTKAFDTVNHDILIAKLEYCGIVGRTHELIKPYLSNRYQRVTIKSSHASNYTSAWELVNHGVTQGSILGPLLFLFYINDLPQLLKGKALPILFADNSSFIISNSDLVKMDQGVKVVLEITQK
jgi:hypothetical protein